MAEISFLCPQCNQKITCDELWGGHEMQCPGCQAAFIVPQAAAAAEPPPPPAPIPPAIPPASSGGAGFSSRPSQQVARTSKPVYRQVAKEKPKSEVGKTIVAIIVVLIALGVLAYFLMPYINKKQNELNQKADEAAQNSDGGQVGHIANLYEVLDATEGAMGGGTISSSRDRAYVPSRRSRGGAGDAADAADEPAEKALPVIPPTWTLDVLTAQIPQGRANGSIAGTNMVVDFARLDMAGTTPVLTLRHGTNASPDRELLIYLRVKPGDKVAGGSWAVSKDMKGPLVPKVTKRWKPNPKYAATKKDFDTGYAMRLEFGQISWGEVTGKIFVALPDTEQSVVAGIFTATTSLPDTTNSFRGTIGGGGSEY